MNNFEALVLLNMIPGLGSITIKRLLDAFDNPKIIFSQDPERLAREMGVNPKVANRIGDFSKNKELLYKELSLASKNNVKIITILDKDYPENLKQIYDPPSVLYIRGEIVSYDRNSISIVGSRRASFYGLSSADRLSFELASLGITIVSGLARGIDTQAHKAAIRAGGRTIAVLGSGLLHIYPPENKELIEEIAKKGAVVSEFSLDTPPLGRNFPRRNRIISGFSLGTIVVEAAVNSGALITADLALQQGREVFAVPGAMDSNTSLGTNNLIKDGAKLVMGVEDILEEIKDRLELYSVVEQQKQENNKVNKQDFILCDKEINRVYDFLSERPKHIDEIIEATRLDFSSLSRILLALQLKRLIKELPGKNFKKIEI